MIQFLILFEGNISFSLTTRILRFLTSYRLLVIIRDRWNNCWLENPVVVIDRFNQQRPEVAAKPVYLHIVRSFFSKKSAYNAARVYRDSVDKQYPVCSSLCWNFLPIVKKARCFSRAKSLRAKKSLLKSSIICTWQIANVFQTELKNQSFLPIIRESAKFNIWKNQY